MGFCQLDVIVLEDSSAGLAALHVSATDDRHRNQRLLSPVIQGANDVVSESRFSSMKTPCPIVAIDVVA